MSGGGWEIVIEGDRLWVVTRQRYPFSTARRSRPRASCPRAAATSGLFQAFGFSARRYYTYVAEYVRALRAAPSRDRYVVDR